jgi:hypothetical protein
MIDIDKVNFDGLLEGYKRGREMEATKLKVKLERAARWQKRYDALTDKTTEEAVASRLDKLKRLAAEHHIRFNLMHVDSTSFSGGVKARYLWGDVVLDLEGWLTADSSGVVVLSLRQPSTYQSVYRISVGQRTTITNNILQVLMSRTK